MKKTISLLLLALMLQSCVVNTAAKVVKTTGKIAYGTVKGTVKGVSWAVKKAEGKINENRLDGNWKVVGVYKGTYEEVFNSENPENIFNSRCASGDEVLRINAKKSRLQPVHCSSEKSSWEKYKFKFGKNPQTKNRENYLEIGKKNYISIINLSGENLILEGNLMPVYGLSGGKVYLLEKVR